MCVQCSNSKYNLSQKIKTLDLRKMERMLNQKLYPEIKCTTSLNVQSDKIKWKFVQRFWSFKLLQHVSVGLKTATKQNYKYARKSVQNLNAE